MNLSTDEHGTVVVEREFPYPPEKLWRAITQPHLIEEWLMKNDFQLEIGHLFSLHGDWGGVLQCEVLEVEPERILSYTWNFPHENPAFNLLSTVTFSLAPTKKGTNLKVEQTGFHSGQKQALAGAKAGWGQFLGKLDQLLTRNVEFAED